MFFSLGLTGMFGGQLAYILGIYYANPNIASLYQPAMPVWAAVFVIIARVVCMPTGGSPLLTSEQENVPSVTQIRGLLKIFGILLASGGALLMILGKGPVHTPMLNPALGNICSLANTLLFAVYMTIQVT